MTIYLKRIRKKKGMSQEVLAQRAGISRSFLCEIERGRKSPSLATLERLAAALDIRQGELIDGDMSEADKATEH